MRIRKSFEKEWLFHKGDIPVMHAVKSGMAGGFTDCGEIEQGEWLKIAYFDEREPVEINKEEWQEVQIPHDWCVEGEYVNDEGAVKHHKSHGYLYGGIGFYRKEFQITEEWIGRRIGLEFDGIFRNSTIWVNGHELLHHRSGYTGFHCDLTDVLRYGKEGGNVILIRVDAREYEGWWYEGAGIYRHVWLTVTGPIHIKRHGIWVSTPEVTEHMAKVSIETTIENRTRKKSQCQIISQIEDMQGNLLRSTENKGEIVSYEEQTMKTQMTMEDPHLWTPETPYLYTLLTKVYQDGQLVDTCRTQFGVRTVEFHPEQGFLLNGHPYVIKGACCHQDFAGVGVALPDSLIAYKLKLLKEMGCNAYRSSHHPATPEVLEMCDRMGMLVMDENRRLDSSAEGIEELKELIYRGRNHPCIFMWSMENEEILEGTIMGTRILQTLVNLTHSLDPYRPVTAAMNHGWNDGGYSEVVDVTGYNYGQRSSQDISDHEQFPDRCMIGSESASCTVTRGIYKKDDALGYCPEYGTHIPEWSCTIEKAWTDVAEHPFLSGLFIWTGFDYRGDPTPYEWPNINSHFGVMDTCGFPKDHYYYLKSQWTQEPILHILPHWNWVGEEGEEKNVWVYSNQEEVELWLNGKSLGRQKRTPYGHLEWTVPYEKGELCAVGYCNGAEVLKNSVMTAGQAAGICLEAEKDTLYTGGKDTCCIRVKLIDSNGNLVPDADRKIKFQVQGAGKILGVGNGNPSSHEADKGEERKTFQGRCLLIIQASEDAGGILIHASTEEGELSTHSSLKVLHNLENELE